MIELSRPDQAADGAPSAEWIAEALRTRVDLPDRIFDRFLPDDLQRASEQYWTPLVAIARAAEWLDELGLRSVVDIGSGAGKFCVAAALAGRAQFVGLEHRPRLVAAARELARRFGVLDRVSFVEAPFGEVITPVADAYYLYNPFHENVFDSGHLDHEVELSEDRLMRDIAATEEMLELAPVATCLLTYNGFGGQAPRTYREIRVDLEMPAPLRMYRKVLD